ncbi:MAG: hypothetical protein M3Q89_06025 [Verrucomicrobiota bacterium]|nr:hypothetical protein [Verrucomicrobiota bacterium]
MKTTAQLLTVLIISACAIRARADQVPFAIVHGPKAAFNIAAPEGWVIDNTAGEESGLPCVLYRKGATWETADPLMYAKIASTSYENAEAFAKTAIEEMTKQRGQYKTKRVESGQTKGGQTWFVNEYSPNKTYPRLERVAYIQLPKAVAYIVYSADSEAVFRKHRPALKQLLESFSYLEPRQSE